LTAPVPPHPPSCTRPNPGYVMLVDYLKKEKKMGMKLVKINI
jgi:hypothetical protein